MTHSPNIAKHYKEAVEWGCMDEETAGYFALLRRQQAERLRRAGVQAILTEYSLSATLERPEVA